MRTYKFSKNYSKLLAPDIVTLLTQIHEYKREQTLFIEAKADTLTKLMEIAKIQSTEASNKIEGIYTSDERFKKLVQDKTTPRTRNEQEIAGYRDVLATIHESFDYIPPKPSVILQLHRDLYRFSGASYGGHYKTTDNVIAETDAQGNKAVRFQPIPAWATAEAMEALYRAYEESVSPGEMDPLLLIPMFVLDFLCIHPFNDGNGRMSRLLTLCYCSIGRATSWASISALKNSLRRARKPTMRPSGRVPKAGMRELTTTPPLCGIHLVLSWLLTGNFPVGYRPWLPAA